MGALSNSGSTTAVGRKNLSLVSSGSQASTVVTQQQVQPQARPEDYLSLFVSTANLPLESQKSTLVASISCHRTSELHFGKSIWQRHKSARESSSAAAWSSGKRPPSSASATSATGSTVPRSQVAEEAPCCLVAPSYGNIPFETLHLGVNLLQCLVLVDENVFDNLALASPTGGGSAPESTNMDATQLFTRGAEDDSVRTLSKKMIFLSLSVKGLGVCLQRSRLQDECALLLRGLVLENLLPFVDRDIVLCTDSPWLHSREDISSDAPWSPDSWWGDTFTRWVPQQPGDFLRLRSTTCPHSGFLRIHDLQTAMEQLHVAVDDVLARQVWHCVVNIFVPSVLRTTMADGEHPSESMPEHTIPEKKWSSSMYSRVVLTPTPLAHQRISRKASLFFKSRRYRAGNSYLPDGSSLSESSSGGSGGSLGSPPLSPASEEPLLGGPEGSLLRDFVREQSRGNPSLSGSVGTDDPLQFPAKESFEGGRHLLRRSSTTSSVGSHGSSMYSGGAGLKPLRVSDLGTGPPSQPLTLLVDRLRFGSLWVFLTARLTKPVDLSLEDTPIHSTPICMQGLQTSLSNLLEGFSQVLLGDALMSAPSVLFSIEAFGNISGMLRAVSSGLEDVVRLPRERLRRGEGAAGLLVGITVGAGSLTRRMFHWGTRTLAGLSTTVSRAMDRLSMEDDIERLRTELRAPLRGQEMGGRWSAGPPPHRPLRYRLHHQHQQKKDVSETGFLSGVRKFGSSLWDGASGLISHPLRGAMDAGPRGFLKGVARGVVGALTKPVGGVAELVARTSRNLIPSLEDSRIQDLPLLVEVRSRRNRQLHRDREGCVLQLSGGMYSTASSSSCGPWLREVIPPNTTERDVSDLPSPPSSLLGHSIGREEFPASAYHLGAVRPQSSGDGQHGRGYAAKVRLRGDPRQRSHSRRDEIVTRTKKKQKTRKTRKKKKNRSSGGFWLLVSLLGGGGGSSSGSSEGSCTSSSSGDGDSSPSTCSEEEWEEEEEEEEEEEGYDLERLNHLERKDPLSLGGLRNTSFRGVGMTEWDSPEGWDGDRHWGGPSTEPRDHSLSASPRGVQCAAVQPEDFLAPTRYAASRLRALFLPPDECLVFWIPRLFLLVKDSTKVGLSSHHRHLLHPHHSSTAGVSSSGGTTVPMDAPTLSFSCATTATAVPRSRTSPSGRQRSSPSPPPPLPWQASHPLHSQRRHLAHHRTGPSSAAAAAAATPSSSSSSATTAAPAPIGTATAAAATPGSRPTPTAPSSSAPLLCGDSVRTLLLSPRHLYLITDGCLIEMSLELPLLRHVTLVDGDCVQVEVEVPPPLATTPNNRHRHNEQGHRDRHKGRRTRPVAVAPPEILTLQRLNLELEGGFTVGLYALGEEARTLVRLLAVLRFL